MPQRSMIGLTIFTLLYPALSFFVDYVPNPMVPGAIIALNMIVIVLAGYFYGPWSGAVAGGMGTALSALIRVSMWDGLAIFPHIIMGFAAGWVFNKYRSEFLSALTVIIGHILNMLFYVRLELLTISPDDIGVTLLGLATEITIDVVAIILIIALFKKWIYSTQRW